MGENKIKVSASTTSKAVRVNVNTPSLQGAVTLSPDTSAYNANIAEQWAISENIVLGKDYSSKYYASKAKESANNAQGFANSTKESYYAVLESSENANKELIKTRDEALINIETARVDAVDSINSNKTTILSDIEFVADGEKQEINELADVIKDNANTVNIAIEAGVERLNSIDTLKKSQITNCLLEVPQNIKLELNNGVLTLKAGSIVTIPYGTTDLSSTYKVGSDFLNSNLKVVDRVYSGGKFFVWAKLQADKQMDSTSQVTANNRTVTVVVSSGNLASIGATAYMSGTTEPEGLSSSERFYNTTTNYIYNGGTTTYHSFPICVGQSVKGTGWTSIDQVFNGFGYIGSTIWVDKGVKGLKPNGRNEDGSLNNTEIITTGVKTRTLSTTGSGDWYVAFNPNITWTNVEGYSYDEEKNMILTGGTNWGACVLGRMQFTNGVITSFQPKLPVHLLTYDDIKINNPYFFGQYIWSEFAPDNLSWLKSGGQWNSGYTSFYEWVLSNANANKSGFKLSTASYTDYDFVVNTSAKTFRLPIKVKGKMGEAVVGNGSALGFDKTGLEGGGVGVQLNTPYTDTAYMSSNATFKVQTDATKSGLVLDNAGLSLYFYVGETVRDAFLIDVAQIASNFADKIGRTECKAYITQTYVNGTSGYRIWSDKYCEQWGISTGAMPETVTLLKPYKDTNGNILITPKSSSTPTVPAGNPFASWISNSQIRVSSSQNNWAVFWETKGYVA